MPDTENDQRLQAAFKAAVDAADGAASEADAAKAGMALWVASFGDERPRHE